MNVRVRGVYQSDLELERCIGAACIADEQGGPADNRKDGQRLVAGGGAAKEINPAATRAGVLVAQQGQHATSLEDCFGLHRAPSFLKNVLTMKGTKAIDETVKELVVQGPDDGVTGETEYLF